MASKFFLVFCGFAVFAKTISTQCTSNGFYGSVADGVNLPISRNSYGPSFLTSASLYPPTGGRFFVRSVSPFAPIGLAMLSENVIDGRLFVSGQLPFLSSVGVRGTFDSVGTGTILYSCGDGYTGITSEGPIATGIINPGCGSTSSVGYAPAAVDYNSCSCGTVY